MMNQQKHTIINFQIIKTKGKKTLKIELEMMLTKCKPKVYNKGYSATLVPVFAYNSESEEFIDVYKNNDAFFKILKITNWENKEQIK